MQIRIIVSALLIAAAGAPASAQSYDQLRIWCFEEAISARTVQGCAGVIQANRETPEVIATAFFNRGLAYRKSGDNDRALQDYNQALRLKPDHANALNSRCYLLGIVGQLQAALQDCNQALRLAPRNQYAFDSRGFAYLKLGMLDASIADYSMALQIEPDRPYSLFGRGVARRKKGDVGGDADMAAAKAKIPGIAEEFARYGVKL